MLIVPDRKAAISRLERGVLLHRCVRHFDNGTFTPVNTFDAMFVKSDRSERDTYFCRLQFGIESTIDITLEPVLVSYKSYGTPVFIDGETRAKISEYIKEFGDDVFSHLVVGNVNDRGTAVSAYWNEDGWQREQYDCYRRYAREQYDLVYAVLQADTDMTVANCLEMVDNNGLNQQLGLTHWQKRANVWANPTGTDSRESHENYHVDVVYSRQAKPVKKHHVYTNKSKQAQ